jgi:hypothetical protein
LAPDRIAEDAPVPEISSLLIAVPRTTARIGSRSASVSSFPSHLKGDGRPRRFPTLTVAAWSC